MRAVLLVVMLLSGCGLKRDCIYIEVASVGSRVVVEHVVEVHP